jgi:predicted ATPase/class 3 adenylate cyclase
VVVCSSCGAENRDGARFCDACAAPLAAAEVQREQRKTVTVVFCDVSGSTALGERLDPESLRRVMARYFESTRSVVERHGGTVEKFIGDAVMAIFGVPVLHEDDALRAIRAASEIRESVTELNQELERDYATTLALRIGVNTGEVVIGTEERLATGDAVNVAARLEQAAEPGEIWIGQETIRLVRDAVETEPLPPLALKGKAESLAAFRLVSVQLDAPGFERRLDAPMVGRERQLKLVKDAFANCVSEQACGLFTILGPAGVGKSRITEEFLKGVDAQVVRGRCLSYGDGISYWPVVEVVKQLLGEDPERSLLELVPNELAAPALSGLLGSDTALTTPDAIAWTVRKLLEAVAAERPLVVAFDDIHWGEPTFLDLIEHVADLSRNAPILLLCTARPELLDARPGWSGGKLNATTVLLEPLSSPETDELISVLLGSARLDDALRARIREAAEGNPLFVEEMLAMVQESGGDEVIVPPTIQALLAARLDQLEQGDRSVLERGSVEGKTFHRGALLALAPEEPQIDARLTTLIRKELVRPARATLPGDDAYRFRHLLIRDAAYDALPKATRAALHERFARWLDERGTDVVERDEIVGYHFEQAFRYRAELGPVDASGEALGRQAAQRLLEGGRTALARRDIRATAGLAGRAVDLLSTDDGLRLEGLLLLATALVDSGDLVRATELLEEALARARARGDERLSALAELRRLEVNMQTDPSASVTRGLELGEQFVTLFERLDDEAGLGEAWGFVARMRFFLGRAADAEPAYEQSLEHARRAGDRHRVQQTLGWWAGAKRWGPASAAETLAFLDEITGTVEPDALMLGQVMVWRGALMAMEGRFDEARASLAAGLQHADEFGLTLWRATWTMEVGQCELLAGDPEAAERALREGYAILAGLDETGFRATIGALLGEALVRGGRDAEAAAILTEVAALAAEDDMDPQVRSGTVRAELLARAGELEEAERVARGVVARAEQTDYSELRGAAFVALGRVLQASGRMEEASEAVERAVGLYEEKGNRVSAASATALLDELRDAERAPR